jgi:hypothetical protein
MRALDEFEVTLTFCFTPESSGVQPHHTSPPKRLEEYADFCAQMVRRYAPGGFARTVAPSASHGDSSTPGAAPCSTIGLPS